MTKEKNDKNVSASLFHLEFRSLLSSLTETMQTRCHSLSEETRTESDGRKTACYSLSPHMPRKDVQSRS
jgi:hypothetical protein